ncbi:OLC1v1015572C2 [Oldenlandia corymbosa var. corymbosa]|uniref:OLC1v1015572C2 n=1 Tax=Oldenlandia corymbosa var. corymbosa TaxID=529605 RepID=A0AAV1E6M2_OLDCO|nr:OLC1v1015572C2 [Oldenlandia corymbosa var. corymbosa]
MELFSKTADNNHKLQNGEKEEEESQRHFSYAMQLVTSISLPMVLMFATRLGLFDIIAGAGPKAQLSPSQIASRLSKSSPTTHKSNRDESNHLITNGDKSDDDIIAGMLDRRMRLLASHSVLTCSSIDGGGDSGGSQRMYGLAPVGEFFVRNKHGVSLGPFLDLIQDKVFTESWYELEKAVVEGGVAFDKAHGTYSFDYPVRDSRFNEVFNKAMVSHTTIVMDKLLESYKGFENIKTLVDAGGGLGVTLEIIRAKYPNLRGINFDLPHVIQHAPPYTGTSIYLLLFTQHFE